MGSRTLVDVRIGVISDTHDNLRNVRRIVSLLEGARVDRVVHTGDITKARTLDVLSRLRAPVVGVYGNNDRERESLAEAVARHGFHFADPPLSLVWSGRRLVVVHDPLEFDPSLHGSVDVVLHGHSHRPVHEQRGETLVFNPGECAGFLEGHNRVGVLDLVHLSVEVLRF